MLAVRADVQGYGAAQLGHPDIDRADRQSVTKLRSEKCHSASDTRSCG